MDHASKQSWFVYAALTGWMGLLLLALYDALTNGGQCPLVSRLHFKDSISTVVFFFVFIAFAIGVYGSYRLLNSPHLHSKIVTWLPIVMLVLAYAAAPFNSHDLSFYYSAGRAVATGTNVFVDQWAITNVFYCPPLVGETRGIMYGPLALQVMQGMYKLSAGSALLFVALWKALMAAAFMAAGYVGWRLVRTHETAVPMKRWFFMWSLQALMVWEWIGNGHFDILWLLAVLLAALMATQSRWWLVIPLLVIGIWIKFVPLLMVPWFVLWWWQDTTRATWKQQLSQTAAGLIIGAFITVLAWRAFWAGSAVFATIVMQSKWVVSSLFGAVYYSLKPLSVWLFAEQAHWVLTRLVHLGLLALAVHILYPLLRKAIRAVLKREQWHVADYLKAIFISMMVYLSIWQKSFWPWYVAWLIPFGLIVFMYTRNRLLLAMLTWLGAAPLFFYSIAFAYEVWTGNDATPMLWFAYSTFIVIWVYPLIKLLQWRKESFNS